MAEFTVAKVEDIPVGGRQVVTVNGREIGIFNVSGAFYALPNRCTHQAGPLCEGRVSGTLEPDADHDWDPQWVHEGAILLCPWHSLEFNITTGRCVAYPRVRLRQYPVRVEDGEIKVRV